ncbi:hypothetical protein KUTeg_003854 [Tegillarca granosa]|uniref:EGF-like domain-containing protein n=1 Tax=Tegillarca granosa TaxID=220873 RepID=A0ABQ9FST9_TEGGR|nr:hypothetical protein KUTeg_003854 [Tegillarca granosa]
MVTCPPGSFRNATGMCELCPLGTFKNFQGSASCVACSPWKWTYNIGSTSETDCVATCRNGLHSSLRLPPCSECPANHYRDTADTCTKCPTGSSTSCKECPVGTVTSSVGVTSKNFCFNADTFLCYTGRCQNGAACRVVNRDYVCDCPAGFTGKNCEFIIDYCASQPCFYGNCTNSPNNYVCDCLAGVTGTQCEIEPDDCSSNPCNNGAVCIDGVLDYTCLCLPGYHGKK